MTVDKRTGWTIHDPAACVGQFCPFHNPSPHKMVDWPKILRETTLIERQCEHGVGHPDPDSAAYLNKHGPIGSRGTWNVHGCDGCCKELRDPK